MIISVNNYKVKVENNDTTYEFNYFDLIKFALIVNDNSRRGQTFRAVSNYLYENDIQNKVASKKSNLKGDENVKGNN